MRLLCAAFGSVLVLFTASFAGLLNTKCSSCWPPAAPWPTIPNTNSPSFPAPSCGQTTARDSSKYRAWRFWCSQARRSRHLDLTEIPSNLQPHSVDDVTAAFGSSGLEFSFLHPEQKSPTAIIQINSNLTCFILHSFHGINRKKYSTPIFPLNFLSYS